MVTSIADALLSHIHPDHQTNARRNDSAEGMDELMASISAHGLAQSLLVRPVEGKEGHYRIIAGHRRHRALQMLAATSGTVVGEVVDEETYQVPLIVVHADDQHARELSQAENLIRLPQHPADTYQTFRLLADTGMNDAQIAERFGIDKPRVRRFLRLGEVAPEILEAWREGELDGEDSRYDETGQEIVEALTLAATVEDQLRVFNDLGAANRLSVYQIRRELGCDDHETQRFLRFISPDVYKEAGGTIIEDLFGDNNVIGNKALVMALARQKMRIIADEAISDGWAWASMADDLPAQWSFAWDKLPISKKKATKADKARSGVVFDINFRGELNATYGVIQPATAPVKSKLETKQEAIAAAREAGEPLPVEISNALLARLSDQATQALGEAVRVDNRVALCALLAAFLAKPSHYDDNRAVPVRVYMDGPRRAEADEAEPFSDALARMQKMTMAQLLDVVAGVVGQSVNLTLGYNKTAPFTYGADALATAIDAKVMNDALLKAFDATDYFNSIPMPAIVAAVSEAINDEESRKVAKQKKPAAVAYAVANIPATGWLPVELRTSGYAGPGAK